jgi:uncharacterized protein
VQIARKGRDWRVTTREIGDLDPVLARHGRPGAPLPGIDDADRLHGGVDVQIAPVVLSLTPLLRRVAQSGAHATEVTAPLVVVPSLAVLARTTTVAMPGRDRAQLSAGEHSAVVDLDLQQFVAHYPGPAQRVA